MEQSYMDGTYCEFLMRDLNSLTLTLLRSADCGQHNDRLAIPKPPERLPDIQ